MIEVGTVVDVVAAQGRGRVLGLNQDGRYRIRLATGQQLDIGRVFFNVVSKAGDRDHELRSLLCQFGEWSTDWDRHTEAGDSASGLTWDELYDRGIDLLRDFARASGLILDSDEL